MKEHKIAILRLGAIGDVVHTIPLVRAIRENSGEDSELIYITDPSLVPLLKTVPGLDVLFPWSFRLKPWQLHNKAKELRSLGIQELINLQPSWKSRWLINFLKPNKVFTYQKSSASSEEAAWQNFAKTYLTHAELQRIRLTEHFPLFRFPQADRDQFWSQLDPPSTSTGKPSLALIPGVGQKRAHRAWPSEHWVSLLRMLGSQFQVYLVGGEDDFPYCQSILAQINLNQLPVRDLCGKLSLLETAMLLSGVDIVLGADTGPTHIAGAVNPNTIVLFGPTSAKRHAPFQGISLKAPYECHWGCNEKHCAQPNSHCLSYISPSDVYNVLMRIEPQVERRRENSPPNS